MIIDVIFWTVGLHETLALLTSQLHPDANHKGDLVFLQDVFSEKGLSYIMKVDEISSKSDMVSRAAPQQMMINPADLLEVAVAAMSSGYTLVVVS